MFYMKINQILPQEHNFTEKLSTIALVPKMLYFYGVLPQKPLRTVAIVGARKHSAYGAEVAYALAYQLAQRGVVVLSGLAYGIDSVAHKGAVDAGGLTVAVLGTPIDQIYPARHVGLAKRIVEQGGCVLSEYAPGALYYPKTSFLARNRIISGLSNAVVVVEAAVRSGSLNTAMQALEQGRELFAVPGNITSPLSQGCNRLIQQGAMPLTGVADILQALSLPSGEEKTERRGDTVEEEQILQRLRAGEREGEAIVAQLDMTAELFNQTITLLEIKGLVQSLGANRWGLRL